MMNTPVRLLVPFLIAAFATRAAAPNKNRSICAIGSPII